MLPKLQHQVEIEEHSQNEWQFIFTKAGILTSKDLDMLSDLLVLQGIPDIVFGFNTGILFNEKHKFAFFVNATDALFFCNFQNRNKLYLDLKEKTPQVNHISIIPEDVKLKFSDKWKSAHSHPDVKTLERISDTFYATPYKGSVVNANQIKFWMEKFQQIKNLKGKSILDGHINNLNVKNESDYLAQVFGHPTTEEPFSEPTNDDIPLHNLTEKNPIVWAAQLPLYDDELGDNGHVNCEYRFRAMKDCFFGLLRTYLRVDEVIVRIYDTRIYHDFSWNYILREFTVRESTWDQIKSKGFQFTPQWSVDPSQSFLIQGHLDIKMTVKEKIYFTK